NWAATSGERSSDRKDLESALEPFPNSGANIRIFRTKRTLWGGLLRISWPRASRSGSSKPSAPKLKADHPSLENSFLMEVERDRSRGKETRCSRRAVGPKTL